jgi:YaiO family outer membrane protein
MSLSLASKLCSFDARSSRSVRVTANVLALSILFATAFVFPVSTAHAFQTNLDSLYRVAVLQQRAERNAEAKQTLRLLLTVHPLHHDARNLYARILAWEGDFSDALVQYDSVLMHDTRNWEARFGKGMVLAWIGRYDEAQEIFEQLHAENNADADVLFQLGNVAFWSKKPELGYRWYEQAYRIDSTSVDIVRGLARTSLRVGRSPEALEWYRKLQLLSPGDPEARQAIFQLTYAARHDVQVQWQREFIDQHEPRQHTATSFEYYYAIDEYWKPYLHLGSVSKFGKKEYRAGGGLYGTLQMGTGIFAQLLLSPGASVVPSLDATLEIDQRVSRGVEGLVAYRYLGFDSVTVHVLSPGFTLYPSDRFWFTPRVYFSRSTLSSSTSGIVTGYYVPSSSVLLRFGVTAGDEAFRATTLSEIVTIRSHGMFFGAKARVHKNLALEAVYQYTARRENVRFHQLTAVASFLF